ncbi:Eco57I restriction-modification methylase domain-containing protein [Tenacibaculum finnmarkense]|uniref:Eco57I restriction-modification methylase domain-containing protein n=1 Tax=Tenacibaculum finnmarkense TaxID=2781243 RepID=UPI00187BC1E4|nr:Eco57I restriction-modification methylase domain-containing protein [Tenacibaculum finnmarkense]MBE7661234.1 N-6 DNA methylase [Tenacibaculum finnmarkense genomovar finnmarkense]MCG8729256.1 N-6 DNA methylase [Tenacibaculum finnmarkense]MCG8731623.1 N-6 DNA methylase [Tenacibaculum finnmarkense]MCG8773137.1 N-6 DNA methylase [Tenacibaculum finnmarkense]MCG8836063.1 N-6 DNA methylase [Tenacibaculum finnmarkense]
MNKNIEYIVSKEVQSIAEENSKNKYGQYFTPEIISNFMIDLADINATSRILEPSSGQGIFIEQLIKKGYKKVTGYELDKKLISEKHTNNVINESFVTANIIEKYDLIIGNPPYIRWKNLEQELKDELITNNLWNTHFNSLCDYSYIFILKSIELLQEGGQLIFITPEYWLNTTHSRKLRDYLMRNGFFEEIYHFNETPIFEKVNVSTIIFKFIKSKKKNKFINLTKYYANKKLTSIILDKLQSKSKIEFAEFFKITQFKENENWLLTSNKVKEEMLLFENKCKSEKFTDLLTTKKYLTIGEVCDIGNGLVSGLDKAFQLNEEILNEKEKQNSINVVKAKNLKPFCHTDITRYIFINDVKDENIVKTDYPNYYNKLVQYKDKLEKRYQYNREIPYWNWVFLRNFKLFSSNKERILVPCKERISNKDYFRFSYAKSDIFPTQDVTAIFKKESTKESIYYILAFLNNPRVFQWLVNNGIVKGNIVEFSERPISSIPFRSINFNNKSDKKNHDDIVKYTKEYLKNTSNVHLEKINFIFDKIFK